MCIGKLWKGSRIRRLSSWGVWECDCLYLAGYSKEVQFGGRQVLSLRISLLVLRSLRKKTGSDVSLSGVAYVWKT
jgi:hypothetical protein